MYYSAIGLLAVLILLIENQDVIRNLEGAFEKPAWRVYRRFLFAVLTYHILDREDAKRIPIIALTANAFDEDVQRSLQAGMNAHLTKPIEPNHLYQALGELIYQAEHRNEVQKT